MLKYLFSIILLFISLSLYSQEGIGKFKINKSTTDVIDNIEKDVKSSFEITNIVEFYNNLYTIDLQLKEIIFDDSISVCRDSRIFYISSYSISNIELKNIYLLFYKDVLIEFRCDKNKELDVLFTMKYGRPYILQRSYSNVHSNTLVYDEHIYRFLWKEGSILTISLDKKQVFDGIVRDAGSYFIMYDVMYKKVIEDCDIFRENIKIDNELWK